MSAPVNEVDTVWQVVADGEPTNEAIAALARLLLSAVDEQQMVPNPPTAVVGGNTGEAVVGDGG